MRPLLNCICKLREVIKYLPNCCINIFTMLAMDTRTLWRMQLSTTKLEKWSMAEANVHLYDYQPASTQGPQTVSAITRHTGRPW
jgi:hypothetical protein